MLTEMPAFEVRSQCSKPRLVRSDTERAPVQGRLLQDTGTTRFGRDVEDDAVGPMNIALAMATQKGVAAVSLDEGAAAPGACPHLLSDGLVVRSLIGVAALATACDRRGGIDQDPLAGVVTGAGNSTLLDDIELLLGQAL